MDLSKDIMAVLMNEGQLSLPTLGTFRLRKQPAVISPIEGRAQPPTKQVEFNGNLRLDDGRLARYLMDQYQISAEEAENRINTYVADINRELKAGNLVNIQGLGRLFRDHADELRFNLIQHQLDKQTYGLPDLPLEPVIRTERLQQDQRSSIGNHGGNQSTVPLPSTTAELAAADAENNPLTLAYAFLQKNIVWVVAATGLIFILGLIYINSRPDKPTDQIVIAEPPPPDRTNVSPPPVTPPAEEQTATPVDPRPSEVAPINVPPPTLSSEAIIAVGQFGSQANVNRRLALVQNAGYQAHTKRAAGLTRILIRVPYQNESALDRALNDIRQKVEPTAFIIEKDGTPSRN